MWTCEDFFLLNPDLVFRCKEERIPHIFHNELFSAQMKCVSIGLNPSCSIFINDNIFFSSALATPRLIKTVRKVLVMFIGELNSYVIHISNRQSPLSIKKKTLSEFKGFYIKVFIATFDKLVIRTNLKP